MRNLLLLGLLLVLFLAGVPLLALLAIVSMSTQAAVTCQPTGASAPTSMAVPDSAVVSRLMQMRLAPGYPRITAEQASNAATIAQVSGELGVPRRGLEVALATAIQESGLLNRDHGDKDSLGLFQQRPSQGWGAPAQITDAALATRAFYGRAAHSNNTGLLDIDGWQTLPLPQAAQAVQRSAAPGAYAQWEQVAKDLTDILGATLATQPNKAGATAVADTSTPAETGLSPDALLVLRSVQARFGTHSYIGVGDRPNYPDSDHPSGRAVDVMIEAWDTPAGIDHGTRIAAWIRDHARELGVTYIIWRKQIWSTGDTGWRPYTYPSRRGGPTLDHLDHVHVSVAGTPGTLGCGIGVTQAGRIVYPVPAAYVDADRRNWQATGSSWSARHTGTDFSAPCGVPVYAAHAGIVSIDTTEGWAGTWLVKVTTGPNSLATWYAHLESLDVARGQRVIAGQRIGAVGARGNATGCHLHFEVHLKDGPIYGPDNTDPSTWLAQHATGPEEAT